MSETKTSETENFSWEALIKEAKNKKDKPSLSKKWDNSSMLTEASYNESFRALTIQFSATPEKYTFFEVPISVVRNFFEAESGGKFFTRNIKGTYNFAKAKAKEKENENSNSKE